MDNNSNQKADSIPAKFANWGYIRVGPVVSRLVLADRSTQAVNWHDTAFVIPTADLETIAKLALESIEKSRAVPRSDPADGA